MIECTMGAGNVHHTGRDIYGNGLRQGVREAAYSEDIWILYERAWTRSIQFQQNVEACRALGYIVEKARKYDTPERIIPSCQSVPWLQFGLRKEKKPPQLRKYIREKRNSVMRCDATKQRLKTYPRCYW